MTEETLKMPHGTNERIAVSNYGNMVKLRNAYSEHAVNQLSLPCIDS